MLNYTARFYESQVDGSLRSACVLLGLLWPVFQPKSVVDFGCGRGTWLKAAGDLGAHDLQGFDGPWVEKVGLIDKRISFRPVDMNQAVDAGRKFDLALSVEVAEHLAPARASTFVNDLCRAADVVLFGAAIPGQDGTGHINLQPQSYWIDLFNQYGYSVIDFFRPAVWNDANVEFWYRQNTFLFVNRLAVSDGRIAIDLMRMSVPLVDIVHPDLLHHATRPIFSPRPRDVLNVLRRFVVGR